MVEEKLNIPNQNTIDINSDGLSRSERRKLRREKSKELQRGERERQGNRKLIKNLITALILLIIISGSIYFIKVSAKGNLPTIDDDPYFGPTGAAVTVIEFGDFQCPYTKNFQNGVFKELKNKYGEKIKWVFRDMPTGRHEFSEESSEAAQCANEQGLFWEYHNLLFERGNAELSSLRAYAKELELDMKNFDECISSHKYLKEINKDYRDGKKAGVRITPTFFINGLKIQGDIPLQTFQQIIDTELKVNGG